MDRVFTADGPGVVTSTDTRQGVTWLCIEGAAFSGWYPGHEVTADIGDPGRYVTTPEDFPAPNKGAKLPYNPKPRDRFKDELNIQPTHDLNPNLEPTNSIDSIRNYEPNAVFGSRHPFAKQRHARHFAETEDVESDFDDEKELDFDHVPGNWKDRNPGITDYGPEYDAKNPMVINPADGWVRDKGKFHHPVKGGGDGPFKTSDAGPGSGYGNYFTCLDCDGNGYNHGRRCNTCQGSGVVKDSRRHAEFTEDGLPEGWNSKATPEELDNPFTREHDVIDPSNRGGGWGDHGDPHEPGDLDHAFEDDDEQSIDHPFDDVREAGWGEKFERFWLGDDYDWLTGITDTSKDSHTQPFSSGGQPETNDTHLDDPQRQLQYARTAAGMGMLNDTDADNMSNSTLINPAQGLPELQQIPGDPSHTMTPDGDMQVFSPDQGPGNDLAGAIQNALGEGGDELQGVPVPHEPDGDVELAGIPVPHIPGGGSTLPVPAGAGDEINPTNVESTGNMPVGPNADDALAHMASEFLRRTAGKDYSEGEQNLLMHEMGQASQLPALNLVGSIYEDDDEGSILGF